MRYKILVTPEAETDLKEIVEYYAFYGENLAYYFIESYESVAWKIENTPFVFREVRKGTRRVQMKKFPYTVYFTLMENDLHILCVIHQKRNPSIWKQRIKEFNKRNK